MVSKYLPLISDKRNFVIVVFLLLKDIELWTKEAPLACRNFIQLALEGYYDNTLVHRVIKGFMVQMGDPTGTGTGGKLYLISV